MATAAASTDSHQAEQVDNRYTQIAQFVSGLNHDKIPDAVRSRIERLILTKLGSHVFLLPQVEAIRDTVLVLEKLDDAAKLAKLLVKAK